MSIKRAAIVNAMDDEHFAAAAKATGRKCFTIAGVTNGVCTVFPALSRMASGGVTLSSTNQTIAELTGNWRAPAGMQIVQQVVMPALQA